MIDNLMRLSGIVVGLLGIASWFFCGDVLTAIGALAIGYFIYNCAE